MNQGKLKHIQKRKLNNEVKMNQKKLMAFVTTLLFILFFCMTGFAGEMTLKFDRYHTPEELNKTLVEFSKKNSKVSTLHKIADSPGGLPVYIIEIGPEVKKNKRYLPAVFVAANMEGIVPISSEAAIYLIKSILVKPELRKNKTWYILAVGNPDAAKRYLIKPLYRSSNNANPYNDDMDDRIDEDGFEDLDKNGVITMMRAKDPEGKWIPVPGDPRLMKKADWKKGEKGMFKLYTEGIDNDGDGKYNEDTPGGVNIGINFPHLFKPFKNNAGAWAGVEEESFNLIKFVNDRKEICMVFTFGDTNFCKIPPQGGRKGSADFAKIKIPKRFEKIFNVDVSKTYTMKEIIEIVQNFVPEGFEVTESMIASFLGLGAVVNPLPADLKFYKELSEDYKEFLKKNKLDAKRLEPAKAKDGSFELWAYYHLGLPSFSMDFWTLPEPEKKKKEKASEITAEKLEKMSKEEFLALGEEKINAFLKSSGAPKNVKAKMLIGAVKGGTMTPKKMAEMMKKMPKPKDEEGGDPDEKALLAFSDKNLKGKGFVNWKKFNHPTLGQVEIGGIVPFVNNTPPASMIEKLIKGQVPWILELVEKSAKVKIVKTNVKSLGSGLYSVKAWVGNKGYLPYPTAMGVRNKRIPPIVLAIKGQNIKIMEGKKRSIIDKLGGNGTKLVKWILFAEEPVTLKMQVSSPLIIDSTKEVSLGGSK
jgi:hypothetical protein